MHSRPLRLALQLGLFQLSLGILGVLILGLLNRLLIQDIQVPAVLAGLERLSLVTPLLLLGLGVVSVFGVERRTTGLMLPAGSVSPDVPQRLALPQLLLQLRTIPQAGRFLGVLCLFTFSMFLNDAVLEPYGAAVFGMNVCATTSLNVLIALGFFAGLGLSGFWLIERAGNIKTARVGAVLAALALLLMLWAGSEQSIPLLRTAVGLFGLSIGVCMNACLTLMFSFLLGIWGAGYAYSSGLATISGGGLLTLLKAWNGGDLFAAYGGVFGLQMVCFLAAALMTRRLDVVGFRNTVKTRFSDVMDMAVD